MLCPSCQTNNLPGTTNCFRCGSALAATCVAVDVQPPRATKFGKTIGQRWRRWWNRTTERSRQELGYFHFELRRRAGDEEPASLPPIVIVAANFIFPGWGQYLLGWPRRAAIFATAFLALIIAGWFLFGTPIGLSALAMAFSLQFTSIVDLLAAHFFVRARLGIAAVVLATLALAVYLPASSLVGSFVAVLQVMVAAGPLHQGDVVLVEPRTKPRPGDIAVFVRSQYEMIAPGLAVQQGQFMGRVIALSGQTMQWDGTTLLVDGRPIPKERMDVDLRIIPKNIETKIPPDMILVAPFQLNIPRQLNRPFEEWRRVYLFDVKSCIGVVRRVTSPWSRRTQFGPWPESTDSAAAASRQGETP